MTEQLFLQYSAISDVGRIRKENQDSGYAGPWLLTVCDGVGGAARGDIASSTVVQQLRKLDEPPGDDMLGLVAGDPLLQEQMFSSNPPADPLMRVLMPWVVGMQPCPVMCATCCKARPPWWT